MNAPIIEHIAIAASAGSGKTFQLAHRYIQLLAAGVPPDRISAVTFSRKAAGEIFEGILRHLMEAASDANAAAAVAERIGRPEADTAAFLAMLRGFVDGFHRLHIGTLDSFMVGVARAFPTELGVPPDFQVTDEGGADATDLRRAVLRHLFSPRRTPADDRRALIQAYKQATFGREEKAAFDQIDRIVADYRERLLTFPDRQGWGDAARIWPRGAPWLEDRDDTVAEAAAALESIVSAADLPKDATNRWLTFIRAATGYTATSNWSRDITYLFDKLVPVLDGLSAGAAVVKLNRTEIKMGPDWCRHVLSLMHHIIGTDIHTALETTRGLFDVLRNFDAVYDVWSRRTGVLTFQDAQYLLTAANKHSGGAYLSREAGMPGRLYIDFRLDAQLDHWLIDEFQDTSDLQWEAIRNLIDELIQDTSGARSFFYVGDVKQAIYQWRGGNPRLFANILRTYEPRLTLRGLSTSYRSCPAVIRFVNAVFGDLSSASLPAGAVQHWRDIWQTHSVPEHAGMMPGYAAVIESATPDEARPSADDRYRLAAAIVRELDPLRKGLTTALLVRTNDAGRALVDALRRDCPGMPVVHEGHAPLNDNPVVALMLSLLRFALHPGDTIAWQHLQLSPLQPDIQSSGPRDVLPERLLRDLHESGIRAFLLDWGRRLDARVALDAFGRQRLRDLLDAAAEYEGTGRCDPLDFLATVETHEIAESAREQALRVMTIHQAKGLGFDVVIVPDLEGGSLRSAGALDLAIRRDPNTDAPVWALKMPRRTIATCDTVLRDAMAVFDADAIFEDLCVLYVALTRAKHGLYVVTQPRPDKSNAVNAATVLREQLECQTQGAAPSPIMFDGIAAACVYAEGESDWHRALAPRSAPESPSPPPPLRVPAPPSATHLVPLEPSAHDTILRDAGHLFDREARDVLDFGTAIHALFEMITWGADCDPDQLLALWLAQTPAGPDIRRDVATQFRHCLADPSVQALLARPAEPHVLWREQRFEIIFDDGEWVRGVFDRVLITTDDDGRPVRAAIVDFKSDRVETAAACQRTAEQYREQLDLYARAVARMLQLPAQAVTRTLLFTRLPRIVDLG